MPATSKKRKDSASPNRPLMVLSRPTEPPASSMFLSMRLVVFPPFSVALESPPREQDVGTSAQYVRRHFRTPRRDSSRRRALLRIGCAHDALRPRRSSVVEQRTHLATRSTSPPISPRQPDRGEVLMSSLHWQAKSPRDTQASWIKRTSRARMPSGRNRPARSIPTLR